MFYGYHYTVAVQHKQLPKRPTPQDEDEERSSREKKENRQRVTLRVAWWWFPVVVDEFCNGTVRVGIVHSIACFARFPSSLISDK
ncbi:hypothetical protein OUZ56_019742 [Daphnia magna]|uniref:Uncharacterized protein n=1 Tax=Daphnia magna TaxID=35525 RepID=A0ABQ9ZCG7_9CRUS|nr:hypothetical protein OUZ56_019742 [Daphnia magna]